MAEAAVASPGPAAGTSAQTVVVSMRVRPFNKREMAISEKERKPPKCVVKMRDNTCAIMEYGVDDKGFPTEKEREAFTFDECFWSIPIDQVFSPKPFADQKYVYDRTGYLAMLAAFEGYNNCIFAYGQTGSGKTYSMLGAPDDPGISPRLCDDLFARIDQDKETKPIKTVVECMFYEIYNEKCRDLFNKKSKSDEFDAVKIRQHPTKGVFVDGLTHKEVTTAAMTKKLIERGTQERAMAETKMNAHSSRSHAVFQIQITQLDATKGSQKVCSINLVDLAGSEKVKASGASGDTLNEAKNINQSLSTLRKVIDVLIDNSAIRNKKNHKLPPFRESVLTYVLSDTLGGNSKTQMIAAVSPHEVNTEETLGTLRYALRAKAIVCNAKVNEEKSAKMLDAMRDEIMALQMKLRDGTGGGGGAASAEILQEIQLREKEIHKMEENQVQMQGMLEQAAQKEAELQVAVAQQRKERFAAAFRNAFFITGEKKKQATAKIELDALTQLNHTLTEELEMARKQVTAMTTEITELRKRGDVEAQRSSKDLSDKEATVISLRKQLAILTEEAVFLRTQSEGLFAKVEAANIARGDAERHLQRVQEELLHVTANLEQAKHERRSAEASFEKQMAEQRQLAEEFRKRKDKYKQLYLESNAQAQARSTIIDSMRDDRQTFVTTIKTQQALVAEHSHTAARLSDERREAQMRATDLAQQLTEREQTIRGANEALREYQTAAAEFIFDNHALQREATRSVLGGSPTLMRSVTPGPSGGLRGAAASPPLSSARTRFMDPASPARRT
jgi:hypothetical protein